jgi:hypothetical protein
MAEKPKRPFAVTCLAALVLTFTGMQILRAWAMLSNWDFLSDLPLSVPPIFFVVSGLFWGGLGLWLLRGVWIGKAWAPKWTAWTAIGFAAFGLLDRAILQAKGPQNVTWPFDSFLAITLLALVFAGLALPRVRAYFGADHE